MNNFYYLDALCLRYVVPFKFNELFEDACKKIENQKQQKFKKDKQTGKKIPSGDQKLWVRRCVTQAAPESDLYEYIRDEFRFADNENEAKEQKSGCEWLFWRSRESDEKDGQSIKDLIYFPDMNKQDDGKLPESWKVKISNAGIMLFRNGLGMLWYEIGFHQKDIRINSDELKVFQNYIRELNHGKTASIWEETDENAQFGLILKEVNNHKTVISPFSFGKWVNDMVDFLDIHYMAERKSAYKSLLKNGSKYAEKLQYRIISGEDKPDADVVSDIKVADKAILFTYASFEKDNFKDLREDRISLSYHLTNGYNDSYHYGSDVIDEMRHPFDDVIWYATQEGVSYLAWPSEDNRKTFKEQLLKKAGSDYFTLYMKALYQSFSLLLYAEKIQSGISAVKMHLSESDTNVNLLYNEINLFLTKSMATSVSHIHHQSEFYIYIKKRLRIDEDVDSVTAGLNAMDGLQREMREEEEKESSDKIQFIMGIFTLFGIFSALVDSCELFNMFSQDGSWHNLGNNAKTAEVIIMVVIVALAVCIVFGIFREYIKTRRKDRKK